MAYEDSPINRSDKYGDRRSNIDNYNEEIDRGKSGRNSSLKDTDITVEDDGFLGVDDLDKMRRRKIR